MYRGTTPTISIQVNSNIDLSKMTEIWVTLKTSAKEKTYGLQNILVYPDDSKIEIKLTQEDTLSFNEGVVKLQVRFLDESDNAYASNIKEICIKQILKDGKIINENN